MRRWTTAAGVVAGLTALAVTAAPNAYASGKPALPGSEPRWVAGAKALGRADAADTVSFRVRLAPRGGMAALRADAAAVSDPGSRAYRHFLSAAQYHARYDAADADVRRVTRWLIAQGLTVTGVEDHHRYVSVSGSVASTQRAFGATLNRYRRGGRVVQANDAALTVPAAIAPVVLGVSGLDTTPRLVKPKAAPSPGFVNARPCSLSYGSVPASRQADFKTPLPKFEGKTLPYTVCGYTGTQLRAAYEGAQSQLLDGSGVTVAITDAYASPTLAADAQRYAVRHGDGGYAAGQLTQVNAATFTHEDQCDPSSWYGEQSLDVEAVHAMAPGAKIAYYGAASCQDADLLSTLTKVVDDNRASIVSNSWGGVEDGTTSDGVVAYQTVFLQGALQGVGFLFSSGDAGDNLASTGLQQTDYPASDPNVTAVGGTSDAIVRGGKLAFQTGWGTQKHTLDAGTGSWSGGSYLYGAGGGSSSLFEQPSYQQGVVPAEYASSRAVPDVALAADPNAGMLIGQTQTFGTDVRYGELRIGGTSLASPLFAGMTALTQQRAGGRSGMLNPTIYGQAGRGTFTDIAGTPPDAGVVRVDFANGVDAKQGLLYSVRTFNQDSSLGLAKGWDPVTGIGSPNSGWITSITAS